MERLYDLLNRNKTLKSQDLTERINEDLFNYSNPMDIDDDITFFFMEVM